MNIFNSIDYSDYSRFNVVNILKQRIISFVRSRFGEVAMNHNERSKRFIEEAIETVQAVGLTEKEVIDIVRYVYSRSVGALDKEIGGVGVTLLALTASLGLDFIHETNVELTRVENKSVEEWRARQNAKADIGIGDRVNES
jgi:hypothetical protein